MPLKIVKTPPDYAAFVTPLRDNDWETGSRAAVVDRRNAKEAKMTSFRLSKSMEPGQKATEWWADVTVAKARLRIPVTFADVTRPGGVELAEIVSRR